MHGKAAGYFLFTKLKREKRKKNPSTIYPQQPINTGLISKTPAPKLQTSTLILHLMLHSSWEPRTAGRLAKPDLLSPGNGSLSYLCKPALGFSTKPLSGLIYAVRAYSRFGFKLHLGILLSEVVGDM